MLFQFSCDLLKYVNLEKKSRTLYDKAEVFLHIEENPQKKMCF